MAQEECITTQDEPVPDWCNENVFERNRLPARSYFLPETCLLLNGAWDFHYAATPLEAPAPGDCFSDEIVWQSIRVPSHWQFEGFGRPQYTNVIYPFPVCPPYVPSANPTGTYRKLFYIPKEWNPDSQLRLRFDGVDSAFHLWVNGEQVGYSQGSRNPAEFDISKYARRDYQNTLFVKVYQWCDGSYIEDQDQWWLSGIFRDVNLLAFPSSRIEDFFITTELDSEYKQAELQIKLNIDLQEACELSLALRDKSGQRSIVASKTISPDTHTKELELDLHIENPDKWTAEVPHLYDVELTLKGSTAALLQTVHHDVGFRKVELNDGLMTVNGVPVFLRGTNRHDHHPLHGRAVPLDFIRKDLILMKQHNINAIRCSHYPSHPGLYQIADELGFWVIDEADLECHGFYDAVARPKNIPEDMDYGERKRLVFSLAAEFTSDKDSWREAYLDRMIQLVQRDKNHPSVIVWSLGNEAFYGKNHKAMYEYAKAEDPGRLVHYEGDVEATSADMFSYMYPSVEKLLELAKTEGIEPDGSFIKPIILCEYAHAMGLGPGWLEQYQKAFRDVPRLQGGFIWEWANHGLLKTEGEKKFYAYGGDFGDVPNDGTFVMDGLCFSEHTPGPGLVELKRVIAPVRAWVENDYIVIENGYDFTTLDHLIAQYKVECFIENSQIVDTGHLEIPHVSARHGLGKVQLPESALHFGGQGECWITITFSLKAANAWAAAGHEVAWCQHRLETKEAPALTSIPEALSSGLTLQSSKLTYTIQGHDFSMNFDRTTGRLASWTASDRSILKPAPTQDASLLGFWRAPIDNEVPHDTKVWKNYGLDALTSQLRSFHVSHATPHEVELVSKTYIAPPILAWGFNATTTYRVTSNNKTQLSIKVTLVPTGPMPKTLPRIGLDLRLDTALDTTTWFGLGPGQAYPDFRSAQRVGIFTAPTDELHVPYEVPQESGNRMDTRWARFTDDQGFGLRARVVSKDTGDMFQWNASRYSAAALEAAAHPCDLVREEDVLLRLDVACAGVGTGACGPGVGEEWTVKCEEREFEFMLEVVGL